MGLTPAVRNPFPKTHSPLLEARTGNSMGGRERMSIPDTPITEDFGLLPKGMTQPMKSNYKASKIAEIHEISYQEEERARS